MLSFPKQVFRQLFNCASCSEPICLWATFVCARSSVTIVYLVNQLMFVCKHGAQMSAHITAVHINIPNILMITSNILKFSNFRCRDQLQT